MLLNPSAKQRKIFGVHPSGIVFPDYSAALTEEIIKMRKEKPSFHLETDLKYATNGYQPYFEEVDTEPACQFDRELVQKWFEETGFST